MSLENIGPDHFCNFRAGIGIALEVDRQEMRHDVVIRFVRGRRREDAEETRVQSLEARAEFFAQLPRQRLQRRLARFDLAARQHEGIRAALADQQEFAGRVLHQRRGNDNLRRHALTMRSIIFAAAGGGTGIPSLDSTRLEKLTGSSDRIANPRFVYHTAALTTACHPGTASTARKLNRAALNQSMIPKSGYRFSEEIMLQREPPHEHRSPWFS